MLNNASKFAAGVAGVAVLAAVGTRFADNDRVVGILLVAVAVAAVVIAVGIAKTVGPDLAPFNAPDATPASTPVDPADVGTASYGPLLAGVGATVGVAGGALGPYWVLFGAIATILGVGLWAFDTYATPGALAARDAANVDHRFLGPLALPVVSFGVAISIAYSLSRVLLAVNETASWVIALVVAAGMLTVLAVVAEKQPKSRVAAGLAGLGAVAFLVAGGTFAGIGEREFEGEGREIAEVDITAKDIAFDRKVIGLPADSEAELVFTNLDAGTFHNVAIYTEDEPGTPIFNGRPSAKGVQVYKLPEIGAGTYRYVCDFHPSMVGEVRVTEAAPSTDERASEEGSES